MNDQPLDSVRILPTMTMAQIAKLCEKHNAYVRIEGSKGLPYAYIAPIPPVDDVPMFLRRQAQ